ncbi:DUF1156 domain-containing protein [Methanopyrus sp.]
MATGGGGVGAIREGEKHDQPAGSTHYLHVWWSRKPLTASRAAVLLSLVPEDADGETLRRILGLSSKDAWKFSPLKHRDLRERLEEWFREATGSESPLVADPMAGAGSIPFEALMLGCRVVACELNPVAYIVLKATLEYPIEYGGELLERMRKFFTEIRKELEKRVGEYGDNYRSYIWIKWIECPRCGLKIPCTPNWWLLKKENKPEESLVIVPEVPENGDEVEFEVVGYPEARENGFDPDDGTTNYGAVTCPRCGTTIRREQVHKLFQREFEGERGFVRAYLAAVEEISNSGRRFRAASDRDLEFFELARENLFERWDELITEDLIPTEEIPKGVEIRRPKRFGIDRFHKLLNERQSLAHAELLRVIREPAESLDEEYREPLIVYTMIAFDKMVHYNTICSRWDITHVVPLRGSSISTLTPGPGITVRWTCSRKTEVGTGPRPACSRLTSSNS